MKYFVCFGFLLNDFVFKHFLFVFLKLISKELVFFISSFSNSLISDSQRHYQSDFNKNNNNNNNDNDINNDVINNNGDVTSEEEFVSFSQQVHEMSDELEEDEKSFLLEDKHKRRTNWNNNCKRATGVKHARLAKSASNGRVVATHARPVGKEVMQKMLEKKKKDEKIKILFDDDEIWKGLQ